MGETEFILNDRFLSLTFAFNLSKGSFTRLESIDSLSFLIFSTKKALNVSAIVFSSLVSPCIVLITILLSDLGLMISFTTFHVSPSFFASAILSPFLCIVSFLIWFTTRFLSCLYFACTSGFSLMFVFLMLLLNASLSFISFFASSVSPGL